MSNKKKTKQVKSKKVITRLQEQKKERKHDRGDYNVLSAVKGN